MRRITPPTTRGSHSARLIHIIAANRWEQPWRHALDVCRHFRDAGWSVTAYTRDAKAIDSRFHSAGIDLRHSPLRGFLDIYAAFQLARDLRRERLGTIVHVHRYRDAFAVLLARKLARRKDIKVVSTRHKLRRGATHALARRIYRNLDAQIFISNEVRDRFLSAWPDGHLPFPPQRMHVLTPTVNLGDIAPLPEPQRGPRVILCNTSLKPGTGLETLIDAMPALQGRKTRLRIVGDGDTDYIDSLRRRAQMRGVMEMIDWNLRPEANTPLMENCHISVDPTLLPTPFGPTHIECMALGRAQVLSSAISTGEHIAPHSQVMVFPAGDASALGAILVELVDKPELRTSLVQSALDTYGCYFSWHQCVGHLQQLYTRL